eukprot:Hpha_TRINITY_DN15693_c1_g2::TRINITY_DN15693_c1_g2_i1::g.99317::m.99317
MPRTVAVCLRHGDSALLDGVHHKGHRGVGLGLEHVADEGVEELGDVVLLEVVPSQRRRDVRRHPQCLLVAGVQLQRLLEGLHRVVHPPGVREDRRLRLVQDCCGLRRPGEGLSLLVGRVGDGLVTHLQRLVVLPHLAKEERLLAHQLRLSVQPERLVDGGQCALEVTQLLLDRVQRLPRRKVVGAGCHGSGEGLVGLVQLLERLVQEALRVVRQVHRVPLLDEPRPKSDRSVSVLQPGEEVLPLAVQIRAVHQQPADLELLLVGDLLPLVVVSQALVVQLQRPVQVSLRLRRLGAHEGTERLLLDRVVFLRRLVIVLHRLVNLLDDRQDRRHGVGARRHLKRRACLQLALEQTEGSKDVVLVPQLVALRQRLLRQTLDHGLGTHTRSGTARHLCEGG